MTRNVLSGRRMNVTRNVLSNNSAHLDIAVKQSVVL